MPKNTKKSSVEILPLQPAVALVEGTEADFEAWLKDNTSLRARRQMLCQLLYTAKAYRHNVRVADDALTEQKALRARDAEGYETERSSILNQAGEMEDDWNRLMNQSEHQTEQIEALLRVVHCQNDVAAVQAARTEALVQAASLGLVIVSKE
jgi:hypothetical protein